MIITSAAEPKVIGTSEQNAIWDVLLNGTQHVIVEAVAGSGKTFTITEYARRERKARIGLTAFNKHIADELTQRMDGQANVECMTYHSLGFKTVKANVRGNVQVDRYKVYSYLDRLTLPVRRDEDKLTKGKIASMVGYAKTYGLDENLTAEDMTRIEERHDLDMNGTRQVVFDYVPKVLQWCKGATKSVDFDDMIWLPFVLKMNVRQYDVLCVDEYQDTSLTQQWLAVRGGRRVCAVGDSRQAIYSFRGCDGKGFDKLREELAPNVVTLPLSLTRRCPKAHVAMAQTIVPQIRSLDDAPEGRVTFTKDVKEATDMMRVGDLVVCRVNADLVGTAYALLKRGVKAVVRGRDIGAGLKKLLGDAVKRCGVQTLPEIVNAAGVMTQEQVAKFMAMPQDRGEMRAANAQDRFDCLCELASECKTLAELEDTIGKLFAEFEDDGKPKEAVVLGTVHRTKGLESSRVFILRPDLIPHPMAKKPSDIDAEYNLAYVAVTRAKFSKGEEGEVVFVGKECKLFPRKRG